ncbi:MAG: hypothetical protein RR533_01575 [Carnobacterium sp.]
MTIKLKKDEDTSLDISEITDIQLDAKIEAESILDEAYHQTEGMYRQVQKQLIEFKEVIKEYKNILNKEERYRIQDMEKKIGLLEVRYTIKHQILKKKLEQEQKQMEKQLKKKSIDFEMNLNIKREEHQKEMIGYLDYLRKENEWFISNQEQAKNNLESKEKALFLTMQKKQERYQLNELELTNELDYYNDLTNTNKTKVLKAASVILILATMSIVQLTFSSPQLMIETIIPILIACTTVYLFCIYLVEGNKEKKHKKLFHHNQFLIEQNLKLKEEILFMDEDLKKVMDKKVTSEKSNRSFADNFQFLDIMQQDLKESEMKRKVLESENAALRKYLLVKKNIED